LCLAGPSKPDTDADQPTFHRPNQGNYSNQERPSNNMWKRLGSQDKKQVSKTRQAGMMSGVQPKNLDRRDRL